MKKKILNFLNISKIQYFSLLFLFGFILFLVLNNYYFVYSHIVSNINNDINKQEIIDDYDKIKVQFVYDQQKININALTDLKFSVLNSTTNEHIKNFLGRIIVIEGSEVLKRYNITVHDGDFAIKHNFTNYGNHQILLRIDTNSTIIPASFNVFIPLYQITPNYTTYLIIIMGIPLSIVMTIILLSIARKK